MPAMRNKADQLEDTAKDFWKQKKQQELDGSKNDRNEQERQKKVVSKCLDLLLDAFAQETESQFNKKIA